MTSGRIELLDALRGFALFGILQINLQAWIVGLNPFALLLQGNHSVIDHAVWLLTTFFITAKFYPIFAFLFGYGFSLQWKGLIQRGADANAILKRRYALLLGIGVLHGLLLYFGDILTIYALAGFILLSTAGMNLTQLRQTIRVWLVAALVVIGVLGFSAWHALAGFPYVAIPLPAYDFWLRAWDYLKTQPLQAALFLPQIMVYFLLGAWAARIGLLQHPGYHRELWIRLAKIGILIGMPVSALFTLLKWLPVVMAVNNPWIEALSTVLNYLAALMSPAIVAGFVILGLRLQRASWLARLYRAMADAGRMALTNYLVQSLLMLVLLQGVGLGTGPDGRVSVTGLALLGLGIWLVQLWASGIIMRRFGSGPMEWLWRRITYRQPLPSS